MANRPNGNEKYCEAMVEQICDLVKQDTFTVSEICQIVGINEWTYYDWMNKRPNFKQEVLKAKEKTKETFLVLAKNSLRKLIEGYEADEIRTEEKLLKDQTIVTITTKTKKIFKPDTAAVIFTLTNVDPDNWKNRQYQNVEVENKDALTFDDLQNGMHNLDDDELRALISASGKIKGLK